MGRFQLEGSPLTTAVDHPAAPPADPLAFRALTCKIAYLYRRQGSAAGLSVDDLAATGLVAVWRNLPRFDPDRGSLISYLAQVIRWAIWEALRDASPWPSLPVDSEGLTVEPEAPDSVEPDLDRQELVAELLDAFPTRERQIIEALHCLAGRNRPSLNWQPRRGSVRSASRP